MAELVKTRYPGIFARGARYVVVYRHRGKQHKKAAKTLNEARRVQAAITTDMRRGEHRDLYAITFADYARGWVDTYQGRTTRGFRESTRTGYRRSIEKAIPWFEKHCERLVEVDPRDVRELVVWLFDERAQGRPQAVSTVRGHVAALRAMFATAVEDGVLRHNPALGVRVARAATDHADAAVSRRALGEQDIARLLDAAPAEWRLFFELMIHTGLRISEALELRWGDIAFGDRPMVKVRRQRPRGVVGEPKSAKGKRDVPLSTGLARRLWALQGPAGAPVFASAIGEAVKYHVLEHNVLRPTRKRAGLPWMTWHTLRHTCASLLFAHGKNVKQVQEWLGHSSPTLTMSTYLHLMDDGLGDADFLDDLTAGVATEGQHTQPKPAELDAAREPG